MAIDKCTLNKNLTKADFCGYSLKQIVNIYLANFDQVKNLESSESAGPEETLITVKTDTDGYSISEIKTTETAKFAKIEPSKDSASYNDDLVIGGNGSKYRTHTITFSFNGAYDANLAMIVDSLSLGKFVAVLELTDGSAIMLGRKGGLEATAVSSLSEAAADGQNGITVTLSANTTEAALVLAEGALDAVKAGIIANAGGGIGG